MPDLARLSGLFSSQAGLDVRAKTAAGGASTGEHPVVASPRIVLGRERRKRGETRCDLATNDVDTAIAHPDMRGDVPLNGALTPDYLGAIRRALMHRRNGRVT
jgi:hypothetical protein